MLHRLIAVVFLGISGAVWGAAGTTLEISTPQGGEYFLVGGTLTVRVTVSAKVKTVTVELSRDGTTFTTIGPINVLSAASPRRLVWTVTGPVSNSCVIRATGYDKKNVQVGMPVLSNPFIIGPLPMSPITADQINSGTASANFVLAADGSGGASWVQQTGGGGTVSSLSSPDGSHQSALSIDASGNVLIQPTERAICVDQSEFQFDSTGLTGTAGVHVPQGAIITKMRVFLMNNGTGGGGLITVGMSARIGASGASVVAATGSGTDWQWISGTASYTVDNTVGGLYITEVVTNSTSLRVLSAVVYYTVAQPLP
jgi:hypothetical protein